jgi:hypothetical protein
VRGGTYPYQPPRCANVTPEQTGTSAPSAVASLSLVSAAVPRCEGVGIALGIGSHPRCRRRDGLLDRNERRGASPPSRRWFDAFLTVDRLMSAELALKKGPAFGVSLAVPRGAGGPIGQAGLFFCLRRLSRAPVVENRREIDDQNGDIAGLATSSANQPFALFRKEPSCVASERQKISLDGVMPAYIFGLLGG